MKHTTTEVEIMATTIEFKEKILTHLRHRRDYITNMMSERYEKMKEINCCELEVLFTYNALISNVKNDKLD